MSGLNLSDPKIKAIIEYCLQNYSSMWAAKMLGIIFDCDFRDAYIPAKQYLEGATDAN